MPNPIPPELPIDGDPPRRTKEVSSVDPKPAVGVFFGSVTVLGLSLANRYTPYQPTIDEAGAITVIVGGLAMWLVPPTVRRKLSGNA